MTGERGDKRNDGRRRVTGVIGGNRRTETTRSIEWDERRSGTKRAVEEMKRAVDKAFEVSDDGRDETERSGTR